MVGIGWATSHPGCMDRVGKHYSHLTGGSFLARKAARVYNNRKCWLLHAYLGKFGSMDVITKLPNKIICQISWLYNMWTIGIMWHTHNFTGKWSHSASWAAISLFWIIIICLTHRNVWDSMTKSLLYDRIIITIVPRYTGKHKFFAICIVSTSVQHMQQC